jgi:hypothetical protein
MKKIIFILNFLFCTLGLFAQSHKFEWARNIGGGGDEISYASVTDREGNVYSTGLFVGTTDLDPGAGVYNATAKFYDAYVLKLDASGHFVWANTIPSTLFGGSAGTGITVDTAGNIYVTGTYSDTISFDIGAGKQYAYTGRDNIFYTKLDRDGKFVWAKAINDSNGKGTFPSSRNSKIGIDHSGNIILSAFFQGILDVDSGPDSFFVTANSYSGETLILKANTLGEFTWGEHFSGTKLYNECQSLAVTSKNDIVLSGYFNDTIDLDPGAGKALHLSKGNTDMYLVQLDSFGKYVWSKSFGNDREDKAAAVATDKSDNIYMAGYFTDTIEIVADTGIVKVYARSQSAITMKFDLSGNFKWFTRFGGWGGQTAFDLKLDKDQNIYLLGDFGGRVDFDPGEDSFYVYTTNSRIFLNKTDSNGKFVYVKTIDPSSISYLPSTICIDTFSNLFISGNFNDKMDANPGIDSFLLRSPGDEQVFMIKLGACTPSSGKDSIVACGSFSVASEIFTESGLYKKELLSSDGCDSILTLNLTILPKPEVHTTYISINTLSASTSATSYQWARCPSYTLIPGATSKTYTATADGYYSVIVSNGLCTDTAECNYIKGPMGIEESAISPNRVNIFPNPFSDRATVIFTGTRKEVHLNLYNRLGQLMLSLPAANNSNTLVIERGLLLPGVYFYRLSNTEGMIGSGKLLIE